MISKRLSVLLASAFFLSSLPVMGQVLETRPNNYPHPDNSNSGPYDSRYDAPPSAGPNYIPEGTRFIVRLQNTLDSTKLQPGKRFKAKLAEDLTTPNGLVIPAGKNIKGHVSDVENGFHGRILLSFDEIETRHGWRPLIASVTDVPGEHGVKNVSDEGEIERKGHSSRRMAESAAAGAALGAATGAVTAGGRGAAIGAGAGAGVGVAAGLLMDRDLKLQKGQQLELRLDRPLQVPQS